MMSINEEHLIMEIQARPTLYNKSCPNYKKTITANYMWQEIAEAVGCDVKTCKAKWRNLRDGFCKRLRQELAISPSTLNVKRSSWRFYKQLQFLIPHVDIKEIEVLPQIDDEQLLELLRTNSSMDTLLQEAEVQPKAVTVRGNFIVKRNPKRPNWSINNNNNNNKVHLNSSVYENKSCVTSMGTLLHPQLEHRPKAVTGRENFVARRNLKGTHRSIDNNNYNNKVHLNSTSAKETESNKNYLMSLLPILRRLPARKNVEARIKLQQILFEIEFEN